jgi:hypothetical protein
VAHHTLKFLVQHSSISERPAPAAGYEQETSAGSWMHRSRERQEPRESLGEREREREREREELATATICQRETSAAAPAADVSERPVHCRQLDASQCRLLDARDQCRRLDVRERPEQKEAEVKTQLERKREARAGDRMPAKDRCCCVGGSMCQTTT